MFPTPKEDPQKFLVIQFKLSSVDHEEFLAPPLLGEHTKEVLEDWLGFSEDELMKLNEQQIIEIKR